MKLNVNCVRDVMLKIEELQEFFVNDAGEVEKNELMFDPFCEALPEYGKEEIFYALYNLDQAGYINITVQWTSGCVYMCWINYMTYKGHEFLCGIRDSSQWSAVKKGLGAVRNFSLSAISSVAEGITSAAINSYISLLPKT